MRIAKRLRLPIASVIVVSVLAAAAATPVSADTTARVKDIRPGSASSNPRELAKAGGTLYFSASTKARGRELWKTKGSAASTKLVKDVKRGAKGSSPEELVGVGKMLFFLANDGQVWRTKGTPSSTKRLKAPRWWGPSGVAVMDGKLYWAASGGLWVSGGHPWNTKLLHPVKADSDSGLHRAGDRVYFAGRTVDEGTELWLTDGTKTGTRMVTEIAPGPGSAFVGCNEWAHVGDTVFFTASDDPGYCGWQLWKSDGTSDGTVKLKSFSTAIAPSRLTAMGDTLFFSAYRSSDGTELWKSDGTPDGTAIVKDIVPGSGRSAPDHLTPNRGTLHFEAKDGPHGRELWRSDGTAAGTKLVKDIVQGKRDSYIDLITRSTDGWLFFAAMKPNDGHEPFKSRGTAATTKRITDVRKGSKGGMKAYCTECVARLGGKVFFVGNDGRSGWELWKWVR
jgi:ELWxxDGT repeat protein